MHTTWHELDDVTPSNELKYKTRYDFEKDSNFWKVQRQDYGLVPEVFFEPFIYTKNVFTY